jgi:hypothetical protein
MLEKTNELNKWIKKPLEYVSGSPIKIKKRKSSVND